MPPTTGLRARLFSLLVGAPAPQPSIDAIPLFVAAQAGKMRSPDTLRNYRSDLTLCQAWLGRPLIEATASELESYLGHLVLVQHLSAGTVQRRRACLRVFFAWARRADLRADDPTVDLEAPRGDSRERRALSEGQVRELLAHLHDDTRPARRQRALVLTLYYTGIRRSEARGLDWEAVDLDARTLRVFGKGRRERTIPMPDALVSVLRAWRDEQTDPRGAVFTAGLLRRRLSRDAVYRITRAAMERAGLKGYGPHHLRHTYGTRMAERLPIQQVQKLLGHRRIDTTTIYAHTELGAETRAALEDAL